MHQDEGPGQKHQDDRTSPAADDWGDKAKPTRNPEAEAEALAQAGLSQSPEQWMQVWVREVLQEQRRARRARFWGGLFKLLTAVVVIGGVVAASSDWLQQAAPMTGPHLAVVRLDGTISADSPASAERVLDGLEKAYEAPGVKGVVLRINSPGGSAAQAGQIYDGLRRFNRQYPDMPLTAVVEDIAASGGYYAATGAPTIVADRASLVGSIGVISGGFGFDKVLDQLGIERRLFTAGENKAFLDPFSPMNAQQRAFWHEVLDNTHQQFIHAVQAGRGDRLKDDPRIFSGLVWNGQQALELGLVDQLGSVRELAHEMGVDTVDYTPQPTSWERIQGLASESLAQALALMARPRLE